MDSLEAVVGVIGHVAWPITVVAIGYAARSEIRGAISALGKMIEERSDKIEIGKDGISITATVAAQEALLASLQVEQEQVKSLALRNLQKTDSSLAIDAEYANLLEMAKRYMEISGANKAERTMAKSKAVDEMAVYVIEHGIPKAMLAKDSHEGMVAALAGAILLKPEPSDADLLLAASGSVQRLHVRFRVLSAIAKLQEKGLLADSLRPSVYSLMEKYRQGADAPLDRLIKNLGYLIGQ